MRHFTSAFLLAGCCLLPAYSFAQTEPEELFRRGLAAAEAGDHWLAIDLLQRGRVVAPNDRIDLVLAESLVEVGRWNDANLILARLVSGPDVHPLVAEVAAEHLATLEAQAGVLEIQIDPRPEGSALVVDGVPWGPSPPTAEVRVAPGAHVIAVVAEDGQVLATSNVDIAERVHQSLALHPRLPSPQLAVEAAVLADVPATGVHVPAAAVDPWPWVGLGAGVAAAIAIAVSLIVVFTAPSPLSGDLPTVRIGGGT